MAVQNEPIAQLPRRLLTTRSIQPALPGDPYLWQYGNPLTTQPAGNLADVQLMETLFEEFTGGLPDGPQFVRVLIRLFAAMLLGAIIGVQRERAGKPAGIRTHILVAMGSALFILSGLTSGMSLEGLSRVVQGLATGIGFIGGGAILKLRDERAIEGLTTAAGIWMTSAVGVAVGLGQVGLALLSVLFTWAILTLFGLIGRRIRRARLHRAAASGPVAV